LSGPPKLPPKRDDTLKILLDDSRAKIAEASTIIERGKVTRNAHPIETNGPWVCGIIYNTPLVSEYLYVAARIETTTPPAIRTNRKAILIGLEGSANVYNATGYMRLKPGSVSHLERGEEFTLEPLEPNTQVLVIFIDGEELKRKP